MSPHPAAFGVHPPPSGEGLEFADHAGLKLHNEGSSPQNRRAELLAVMDLNLTSEQSLLRGATTRVVVQQSEAKFEPQITYAPVTSGNGVETVARMRRQPMRCF